MTEIMVSTTNEIIGFKTVRHLGIALNGSDSAPEYALDDMCRIAEKDGANAVIGMRYAFADGPRFSNYLAHGTEVWVEPLEA